LKPARNLPSSIAQGQSILDCVGVTATRLKNAKLAFAHGTTDPVAEAAFLVGETLGIAPDRIARQSRKSLTKLQAEAIRALVNLRITTRKPAAYLLGSIYMRGLRFAIDERAIVPRSYLGEIIDDGLLGLLRDPGRVRRVLDLCTGSGCLAILAARRFPRAIIDAVDLSPDALALARKNVSQHRLQKRIRLLRGDLFAPVKGARYDLIIANPPYVDAAGMKRLPPECRHEPRLAFAGGADGLAIVRRILDRAGRHLTDEGGVLCEVGRGRRGLEDAYPGQAFLWLDTEASSGEVFWLDATQLR
jgi:ribosomal protein L3 glutamine methyltransferase